jgi:phosphonate degradation associated HDIG domain protein
MSDPLLSEIEGLFHRFGAAPCDGCRRESVSALEHALQCAQLAEWAGAPPELVAAALLHDIGHFVAGEPDEFADDAHELRAVAWLHGVFGPAVTEPIRLHVAAKRYLAALEPAYRRVLSPASLHSLVLQGGAMSNDECLRFANEPFAEDALQLRRWDDAAKVPGRPTPPLDWYLGRLGDLLAARVTDHRTRIAALDVA